MFEEMVVSSPHPTKTKKPITVLLSAVFQLVFLGILIPTPLIYTEALPKTMMATMLTAPPPPPPPPPPPAAVQVVHVKPQVHLMDAGKLMQPKVIPKEVKIIKEDPEPDMASVGAVGGVPGGVAGGSMRSEEHTSELQSRLHLVCRLLLEKKKKNTPSMPDHEKR